MFKYRRTLPSNGFELEVENFVSKLHGSSPEIWDSIIRTKIDYARKLISFEVFDLEGGLTVRFFEHLHEHDSIQARLKVRRMSGELDYVKRFHGVKVVQHEASYDFAIQEGVIHKVVCSYERDEQEKVNEEDVVID